MVNINLFNNKIAIDFYNNNEKDILINTKIIEIYDLTNYPETI